MREVHLREVTAVLVLLAAGLGASAGDAAPASKGAAGASKASAETLELYKAKCGLCHLADGNSPLPPLNFTDGEWKHGSSIKEIAGVISEGVPGTAMLPFKTQIDPPKIQALARYVRSFDKKPLAPAGKKAAVKPTKQ
jgi:mono/diheme cytochrome c family protein